MKRLLLPLLLLSGAAFAQDTVRICDNTGCSDRPRNSSTLEAEMAAQANPAADARIASLEAMAAKAPRAAYDLGLRYFRGDGVRKDSYQAIKWMRDAGERGDFKAAQALGRFYLVGLEEMGADPGEAERWLMMAADKGDKEAKKCWCRPARPRPTPNPTSSGVTMCARTAGLVAGTAAMLTAATGATAAGFITEPRPTAPPARSNRFYP